MHTAHVLIDLLTAVPNPPPQAPPGMEGPVSQFIGWMKWVGIVAGLVGFGACGIMMMMGRRNRSNMAVDGATGIPWVLGGLSTLTLAAGVVGALVS